MKVDLKKAHCVTKHPKTPPVFSKQVTVQQLTVQKAKYICLYLLPNSVGCFQGTHRLCPAVHLASFPREGWLDTVLCIKLGNTPRGSCIFADFCKLLGLSHWILYSRQMVESRNDIMDQGLWRPTMQHF